MADPTVLCLIDSVAKGGGAEQLIAGLAPKLQQLGVAIEVAPLSDAAEDFVEEIAASGVRVHRMATRYGKVSATSLSRVAALARQRRFDIYWGHLLTGNTHAVFASQFWGKSIATMHTDGATIDPPVRLRDRALVKWGGFVQGRASARVAVSHRVAADCKQHYGWSDVAVAHNGVDIAALKSLAAASSVMATRSDWRVSEGEFLLVNAARYVPKKGQAFLLQAMASLREQGRAGFRLVMCGGGDPTVLEAEVRRLGLEDRVTLAGVIGQDRLVPLIQACDAFVMPSLREPFGIAAAEALALGKASVLTEVDGFLELVGDSNCARLVPAADPDALAQAVLWLRENPEEGALLGMRASERIAAAFSLDACAGRWLEIFDAVHSGKAIPPCAA